MDLHHRISHSHPTGPTSCTRVGILVAVSLSTKLTPNLNLNPKAQIFIQVAACIPLKRFYGILLNYRYFTRFINLQ
jgi:hypothetical protein